MDLIGVLASLVNRSQTCPTSPTRQTPQKLVDSLTYWIVLGRWILAGWVAMGRR